MADISTERPGRGLAALSIDVEDWFHTENLKRVVAREAWDRCELRVEHNTIRMLEILSASRARATFFVLGWVAEKCPQLVRAIAAAGHEVASHGHGHQLVYSLTPSEFRADIVRSKGHLEDLTGRRVRGYRAPCFSITDWAIPILQEAGFDYDSSVVPTFAHDRYGRLNGVDAGQPIKLLRDGFYEVCIACVPIGKRGLPWGGGGYFRLVPYRLWRQGVHAILRSGRPYVFYIHPWEIDPAQPRPPGLDAGSGFRHRVNLSRCERRFTALCEAFEWMPIGDLIDQRRPGNAAPRPHAVRARTTIVEHARPHLLCIGGEDHSLRIPFLLALRDRGFRTSAAGTGDPGPFVQAGLDYHRFHFDRFFNPSADWAAFKALARLIADLRPDLVQCFDTKLNILAPLAARSVPGVQVVSTINGLGWLYSSRSPKALALRPIWQFLQRSVAHATATTVFQNRDDRTFFERRRLIRKASGRLIAGSGIDTAWFEQAAMAGPPAAQLRHTLGLGGSEVVITVARMTREKGIPTLLKAAAMVHAARPGVRFLLVGPRESEGAAAVTQHEIDHHAGYVAAIGPRSDVPALLGLADVFAYPTEYREGVPRALLEAALAGLPIVTTNIPGCRDVVRDRSTGLIVPTRSPDLLAERILDLLRDRETAHAMGARAQDLVKQEFSLALVVASYAALYEQLIEHAFRGRIRTTRTDVQASLTPEAQS